MVGQVDRWHHWVVLAGNDYRVWLQHVCHTHTQRERERETYVATWRSDLNCLFVRSCFRIYSFLLLLSLLFLLSWSCFIILRLFLIFCALSFSAFFYLFPPWFIQETVYKPYVSIAGWVNAAHYGSHIVSVTLGLCKVMLGSAGKPSRSSSSQ